MQHAFLSSKSVGSFLPPVLLRPERRGAHAEDFASRRNGEEKSMKPAEVVIPNIRAGLDPLSVSV